MRLTSLSISNVLGIAEASISVAAPVLFLAGPNGAGKSSIAEAIRQAMTGEAVRVDLKKEYGDLIYNGAKSGSVSLEFEGASAALVLPAGDRKLEGKLNASHPDALPFLLDPPRFAALDGKERRAFLFGLMGVKINGAAVKDRLAARGCDADLSAAILPYLAAGFESAQKEAQGKAREAKAAWRQVTGETYGSQKAEGWKAEAPVVAGGGAVEAEKAVEALDAKIEEQSAKLGQLQAEAQASAAKSAEIVKLREQADKIGRIKAKLDLDTQEASSLRDKVAQAKAHKAGGPVCDCPACGAPIQINGDKLEMFKREAGDDTASEVAADLAKWEKALSLMENAVRNDQRDLAAAEAAEARLKELSEGVQHIDHEGLIEQAKAKLDNLKDERRGAHSDLTKAREAQRQAAEADTKTRQAAELHKAVGAWEAIAEALSPDGIPGDFLKEAIGPFNGSLEFNSDAAQWDKVEIDGDMNIVVGGRPYRFRSKSEKWRADAIIAATIAKLSGLRFFVLDEFDILDGQGRSDALYLIDDLATSGAIDSAIVIGTLKSIPGGLPKTIQPEWVEGGRVAERRAAA